MSLRDLGRRCMGMAGPPESSDSDLTKRAREVLAGLTPSKLNAIVCVVGAEGHCLWSRRLHSELLRKGLVERKGLDGTRDYDVALPTDLGREVARLIAEGGNG